MIRCRYSDNTYKIQYRWISIIIMILFYIMIRFNNIIDIRFTNNPIIIEESVESTYDRKNVRK